MGCCTSVNASQIDLTHFSVYQVVGKGGFGKVNAIQKNDTRVLMALKRMAKERVVKNPKDVNMVWTERNLMAKFDSPFLVGLIYAFQSKTELFFVMPFMPGGDLRYHMLQRGMPFTEDMARFYAAELLLGLEHLHELKILYVDMKPENALLDAQGHLRLSDFGLSRQLTEKENYQTRGRAGTFGYLAPEALANKDHGFESDVWSFGVVVFEMLHGKMPWDRHGPILSMVKSTDANHHIPFGDEDIKTIVGSIHVSKKLSSDARDLLKGLLRLDSKNRLGCSPTGRGWAEVKEHPWFRNTDWKAMKARSVPPPIKPKDEKNATPDAAIADAFEDEEPKPITNEQQKMFENWEYNVSLTAGARIAPTTKSSSPTPPTPQVPGRALNSSGTDQPPPEPKYIPPNLPPLAGGGNAALPREALLSPASAAAVQPSNKGSLRPAATATTTTTSSSSTPPATTATASPTPASVVATSSTAKTASPTTSGAVATTAPTTTTATTVEPSLPPPVQAGVAAKS